MRTGNSLHRGVLKHVSNLVLNLFTPSDKSMRKVTMTSCFTDGEQRHKLLRIMQINQLVQVHLVTDKSLIKSLMQL